MLAELDKKADDAENALAELRAVEAELQALADMAELISQNNMSAERQPESDECSI